MTLFLQGCLARQKKELDFIQPNHLTVLSAVNLRQYMFLTTAKGLINTVKCQYLMCINLSSLTLNLLCLLLYQYQLVMVCTRNLRLHYFILAMNVSGLYFCRAVDQNRRRNCIPCREVI